MGANVGITGCRNEHRSSHWLSRALRITGSLADMIGTVPEGKSSHVLSRKSQGVRTNAGRVGNAPEHKSSHEASYASMSNAIPGDGRVRSGATLISGSEWGLA